MSKTPTKTANECNYFTPKELPTPNKDSSGISKTVFTHVSNLQSLLNDWTRVQLKGTKICKCISALKLHECENDYFPHELQNLISSLLEALDSLKTIVKGVYVIKNQLEALSKLQNNDNPVICTWSIKKIVYNVSQIYSSLQKELELKQIVTENIAHSRDENLIEVYVSSWEFNVHISKDSYAYLFVDIGVTGIT